MRAMEGLWHDGTARRQGARGTVQGARDKGQGTRTMAAAGPGTITLAPAPPAERDGFVASGWSEFGADSAAGLEIPEVVVAFEPRVGLLDHGNSAGELASQGVAQEPLHVPANT